MRVLGPRAHFSLQHGVAARLKVVFVLPFVLSVGCNRTEEPLGSHQAVSAAPAPFALSANAGNRAELPAFTGTASSRAAEPPPPETPPCVVPLPSEPPPAQRPAANCPRDAGPVPRLARGYVNFPQAPGAPRLAVERARVPAEHERGLMFRTSMPQDQGMLFEWNSESHHVFWMHNTCIPLDMLFIAKDGTIAGILEQVPTLNDEPRSVPCNSAYVLETNAGWCRRHSVRPGTRVRFE